MDFLRCFSECWTGALGHPKLLPSEHFWNCVLNAQKDRKEVDEMMSEYGLANYTQVRTFLANNEVVTWSTLLVLCCEVRQAKRELTASSFYGLLRKILANKEKLLPEVLRHAADIHAAGARSKDCFCTRLCRRMQGVCTQDGEEID